MTFIKRPNINRSRGFSYLEVVLAALLMAVVLVPLLDALSAGVQSSRTQQDMLQDHYRLVAKLEEVTSQSYDSLYNEAALINNMNTPSTVFSDAAGTSSRRLVYVYYYDLANVDADSDPFTISDPNSDADNNPFTGDDAPVEVLWVKAEIENSNYQLLSLVVVQ